MSDFHHVFKRTHNGLRYSLMRDYEVISCKFAPTFLRTANARILRNPHVPHHVWCDAIPVYSSINSRIATKPPPFAISIDKLSLFVKTSSL